MSTAVHQFVPVLNAGDAVGSHVLEIRRFLHGRGIESEVFVEASNAAFDGLARRYLDYGRKVRASEDDVLIHHVTTGSQQAAFLAKRSERLVLDYHNITPVEFFAPWESEPIYNLTLGRVQLRTLARRTTLGLADSPYNEAELIDLGYKRTAVVPILLDVGTFDREVDAAAEQRLRALKEGGGDDWLFVGRIAPNKAQHDLIAALAAYRRLYDPRARLHLVGASSSDRYLATIKQFAGALGVADAVHFSGGVSGGVLAAYYRTADVFVVVSDHEGFCVPVLEAMHHRVPVVAYASSAVPGTVGEGGLLLDDKRPFTVAAAVARVIDDPAVRRALVARGVSRLSDFDLSVTRQALAAALAPLGVG